MQFTTNYREQATGILKGTKQYFLVCKVQFSNQERAIIQERGLYEESIATPAATPPPRRSDDFTAMLMRIGGIILSPIGLLLSCTQIVKPSAMAGAGVWPMFMLIAGIALFTVGKLKDIQANRRQKNPEQQRTLRQLLSNPEFIVYAPALDIARMYEETVRGQLKQLADIIRANVAVPESNTYEL